jgi:hypothetical protein
MRTTGALLQTWTVLAGMIGVIASGVPVLAALPQATQTVLFSTGFEPEEGYDIDFELVGQNGWIGEGSGGNGIVTNFFSSFGQHAFIGFAPPAQGDQVLNIWRPVNLAPIPAGESMVRFSVVMQIFDSSNEAYDDFRWSVYNTNGARLFTVDFDNNLHAINYALDSGGFVDTQRRFDNEGLYELVIFMNFARNLWSAFINDVLVVHAKPITTTRAALNLGDVDAVWAVRNASKPGDNFMVFDEYVITTENLPSLPSYLDLPFFGQEEFEFQFYGEPGLKYAIEVSSTLKADWFRLGTYVVPAEGTFLFKDPTAINYPVGFYRAVQVP